MTELIEANPIHDTWVRAGRPRCTHLEPARVPDPVDSTRDTGEQRCTGCGATWYHNDPVPLPWPDTEPSAATPTGSTAVEVAAPRWGEDAAARAVALARTGQYRAFTEAWLANRQLADATRDAYRGDLGGYLDWCAGITTPAGPPGRPEPIDPLAVVFVHINEYARALEATFQPRTGQPYTAASIARKLSAIGSWYTFLVRLGVLARNPVDGADRPVVDRDHSPTVGLTADEATALVAAADRDPYPAAVRNRALIRLLLRLGARVSEAVGANIGDLGHADGFRTITLRMKRGKTRRRRLPEQTAAAIDTMLAARAAAAGVTVDELDPTAPLFATATGGRLQRSEVYELVRRLARAAGLPHWAKLSVHGLRHTFNTIAKLAGSTLEERQHALGHADPRTTQIYDRARDNLARDPSTLVENATAGPL